MKHKGADRTIEIYWWNLGKKTTDFIGTIGEYLEIRGIKVRKAKANATMTQKWTFRISVSTATTTLTIYENQFNKAAELAILLFLTMLGDKSLLKASRDYKVNWN